MPKAHQGFTRIGDDEGFQCTENCDAYNRGYTQVRVKVKEIHVMFAGIEKAPGEQFSIIYIPKTRQVLLPDQRYKIVLDGLSYDESKPKGGAEKCPLCEGTREIIQRSVRLMGATYSEDDTIKGDEHLVPCPLCCCTDENPCCDRRNEYNGFASGPLSFVCPKHCACHD